MNPLTTLDIPDNDQCPECGENNKGWFFYAKLEEKEIGICCPTCDTKFKNEELSFDTFGFRD